MPLYFAYGSNMDEAAMSARAPKARPKGIARLARHRFILMSSGFASVQRDPRCEVFGLLFDLALSDVALLDHYEEVGRGMYAKVLQPVVRFGGAAVRALIYVGVEPAIGGPAPPGYMDDIVAAARAAGLPSPYVGGLEALRSNGSGRGRSQRLMS
jgi:hypothetical protein